MTAVTLVLAAALYLYLTGGPRWLRSLTARIRSRIPVRGGGAGASAAARARQLRTPAVRIAEALGIRTQAGALATRSKIGAEGERRTAARLAPLALAGWRIWHDRALPYGRANVDHLAITPRGVVLVLDTKRWSARRPVSVSGGRLWHGTRDVTGRLDGLRHEASTVAQVLGVPVIPVVVMDGPDVQGEPLELDGIHIVPARAVCTRLRVLVLGRRGHVPISQLDARVDQLLPPYLNGPR